MCGVNAFIYVLGYTCLAMALRGICAAGKIPRFRSVMLNLLALLGRGTVQGLYGVLGHVCVPCVPELGPRRQEPSSPDPHVLELAPGATPHALGFNFRVLTPPHHAPMLQGS